MPRQQYYISAGDAHPKIGSGINQKKALTAKQDTALFDWLLKIESLNFHLKYESVSEISSRT